MRYIKIALYSLFIIIAVFTGMIYAITRSPIGGTPEGERLAIIKKSKQYSLTVEIFENPSPIPLSTGRSMWDVAYDFFSGGNQRRPKNQLPEAPPAHSVLKTKSEAVRFIWLGHSTILLEIDGTRILIDPVFSDYASPIPFVATRFQPPAMSLEDIMDIDLILISHDHYDHLDYKTIARLKHRNVRFLAPLGVGAHLEFWGIDTSRITELDWWDSIMFNGIVFTCTPSQHFSGRGISNRNSTLWASWAMQGKKQNIFFSGDSGYGEHYKEIGERLGPFDVTFLENGAYSLDWKFVHQLPEEGVQAHLDLKGNTMVPIHWGMFDLALHAWHEPITRVTAEANKRGVNIITPKLGQLIETGQTNVQQDWWTSLINKEK